MDHNAFQERSRMHGRLPEADGNACIPLIAKEEAFLELLRDMILLSDE